MIWRLFRFKRYEKSEDHLSKHTRSFPNNAGRSRRRLGAKVQQVNTQEWESKLLLVR